uniref:Tartrate-resistant acid phosphatase type 5 n=1 Tax=Dugesia japonica TaxID=6161 RepID=A0A6B9CM84_DUGJA|nr:tartrate-resistant acid phosphatase [Dugesia japonica]
MKTSINVSNIYLLVFLFVIFFFKCHGQIYKDNIHFFVIGDWGGIPDPPYSTDIEKKTSREMIKLANSMQIDFLLALGDNFYYSGVESEYDSRFQTTFESVFNNSDLYFPWYVIAGNHDWRGNVSGQIHYSNHSKRWKFPNYFYNIEKSLPSDSNTKLAIIMIDTVILCGHSGSDFFQADKFIPVVDYIISESYWKFIEIQLEKYRMYSYIIVAGHYPVWSVGNHGPTKCLVNKLDKLLKKYNVSAYMNGHDHTLEYIKVPYGSNQSMNYFTIGASNFFDNSVEHNNSIPKNSLKFHWFNGHRHGGLASVSVSKSFLTINLMSSKNQTLYTTKIKPRL